MTTKSRPTPTVTIKPRRHRFSPHWRELWEHRSLFYFLVWRDIKVRYKQTALGALWALLQPLLLMAVFSVVLGRIVKLPSQEIPYPIFALAGLVLWSFFSQALAAAANSLVGSSALISKVYFPRLLLPLASAASFLLDLVIAFGLLLGFVVFAEVPLSWRILWVPAFSLFALVAAAGFGTWLSAINVRYRDVRYAIPFVLQVWLLASPIAYPTTIIPSQWEALMRLNPVAAIVEGFRWSLLGTPAPSQSSLVISGALVLLTLFLGIAYFRNAESTFADVI